MIAATVRAALGAADVKLATGLLGAREGESADALWDDPRLMDLLLDHRDLAAPSPPLLMYVMLRRLLLDLGVDDRDLTDYCASLLLAFGNGDRSLRVSEHDENRYSYLTDLAAEAARCDGERRFRVRVHTGNFALWLTGIFPDYINARRARKGGPDIPFFEQMGRSGFLEASDDRHAQRYGMGTLLRAAGEQFGRLRVAMNRLSDRLMFPNVSSPDRLLRQVEDAFNYT